MTNRYLEKIAQEKGWIGVDLDGTLAHYDEWKGHEHIGEPIPEMIKAVKEKLKEGVIVKIFTARASDKEAIPHIEAWCEKHLGQKLPITNKKDFGMIELWDDRAFNVVKNKGIIKR